MAQPFHDGASARDPRPKPRAPAEPSAPGPTSPHITLVQANLVRVLMGLIMFVTGTYAGVDWAAFAYHFTSPYPKIAGYARTVLCAVLVWMIGDAHVDLEDGRYLRVAFAVTLVADYLLILQDRMIPGAVLFIGVHLLLIARHARGFAASLRPPTGARTRRWLALTALFAFGGAGLLIVNVRSVLERTHMLALDVAYLIVLATSMWMAWGTLLRGFYPRRNAWFIVIGMTCFFCCDVTVGLSAALNGTRQGQVLNNVVGFFYSPALVLLAYSGYHWRAQSVWGAPASRPAIMGASAPDLRPPAV